MLTGSVQDISIGSDSIRKKTFTPGFDAGVKIESEAGKHFTISVSILYSQQGQNYKDKKWTGFIRQGMNLADSVNITSSLSISANYLKIPFELTYYTNPDKHVSFAFYGGFYMALLLNYSIEQTNNYQGTYYVYYNNTSGPINNTSYINISGGQYSNGVFFNYDLSSPPFNPFQIGANAGAGIQIQLSEKLYLPLFIHYDAGFTSIKNNESYYNGPYQQVYIWKDFLNQSNDQNVSNSALGLRIGLKLKI